MEDFKKAPKSLIKRLANSITKAERKSALSIAKIIPGVIVTKGKLRKLLK